MLTMEGMVRIEPVPPADRSRALALLVGASDGARAWGQVARFEALLSGPHGQGCALWWARSLRGPRAVALSCRSPGRTAMIYYGSNPARDRRRRALAQLLRELSAAALREGASFAQVLVRPGSKADAAILSAAGFARLTELIYLRRELNEALEEIDAGLTWPTFRPGTEPELARVIEDTYVGSQDCPGLRGLRRIEDVIAGHKSSGIFRPQGWWLPTLGGECVGCVLVNDSPGRARATEVVYLGVRPAFRRRGCGRAMVRHVLVDSAARGKKQVTLAVDAENSPARRLYEKEGFREVDRREVFVRVTGSEEDSA